MKRWAAVVGAAIFLAGVVLGLYLGLKKTWAEVDAVLFLASSPLDARLKGLQCPLMLAEGETGTVAATLANPGDKTVHVSARAEFEDAPYPAGYIRLTSSAEIPPGGQAELSWPVKAEGAAFKRIVVGVYATVPEWITTLKASCGIPVESAFGLNGRQTFGMYAALAAAGILVGAGLWRYGRSPLDAEARSAAHAGGLTGLLTLIAIAVTVPRWWGLSGVLAAFAVLLVGVTVSDFILPVAISAALRLIGKEIEAQKPNSR